MDNVPEHVKDSRRPVIQLTAAPDLSGGWNVELQVAFLDGRKLTKRGLGSGRRFAGIIAGAIELLQAASHEHGMQDLPQASVELWLAATLEARQ